ncbi:hypothetical protein SANTM175S_00397 [Streptomyces antimycoticus]
MADVSRAKGDLRGHPDVSEMRERYARMMDARDVVFLDGPVLLAGLYFAISPWVVHFALGALVGFGLWGRAKLEETPVFKAMEAAQDRPEAPVREVFTTQPRALIAAILCRVAPDVLYAMFTVFVLTYATEELDMSRGSALTAVLIGSSLQIVLIPLAGALSDRVNRRWLYGGAAVAAGVWPFLFFPLVADGSWALLTLGVVGALVIHSLIISSRCRSSSSISFATGTVPASMVCSAA